MELSFILYIFAAFIVIPGTFFVLSLFNRFLSAGIASIGMLVLFVLFGIQFFTSDGNYIQQTTPNKWPLKINYCPDYLSLLKLSDGSFTCVDTVGVASGVANKLQQFNPNNAVTGPTAVPTLSQKFDLYLGEKDDNKRRELIIALCKDKGLTFEGIFDGLKTYNNVIPRVPGV